MAGNRITADIHMGISYSNDTPNPQDALTNAKNALKIASNENYSSSYAFFKDIK